MALSSFVSSFRADVTRIGVHELPREQPTQRLISLQRFHRIRIGILVEISEQLANLYAQALNFSLQRVILERVIQQNTFFAKGVRAYWAQFSVLLYHRTGSKSREKP